MARGLAEFGGQERLQIVPGREGSNRTATHADDIHVVIFYTLAGGEVTFYKSSSNARNFICAHGRADAAAANRDSALDRACRYGPSQRSDEIGIVVALIEDVRPEINNLMARGTKTRYQIHLQIKPAMIRRNS